MTNKQSGQRSINRTAFTDEFIQTIYNLYIFHHFFIKNKKGIRPETETLFE